MKPVLFTLNAGDSLVDGVLSGGEVEQGIITHRQFPDGESYVRLDTPVDGRAVLLLCSLDRPNQRLMPLLLSADAARKQGALQVGLIAPYLAYMRQDKAFRSGEAISAHSFAAILSRNFDWLVTLEPHLHRISRLSDIFSISARAAQATTPIGEWIAANVEHPFLIGPDSESAPWIERIASQIGSEFTVFEKERLGDSNVRITGTLGGLQRHMTPVVVDDIVSSGGTMAKIIERISPDAKQPAVYVAVHMLAAQLPDRIAGSNALARFVSCNSVSHESNRIDISAALLIEAMELIAQTSARHRL